MRNQHRIAVIIPVLNEEDAIGKVLDAIPEWVDDVVVVDNGSTDETAAVAAAHGGRVVFEGQRGYGAACLAGIAALKAPEIVVFLDGDFSDHPEEMPSLVDPIIAGDVDMMIGSRVRGVRERGALTPQAHFGNWLATHLIRFFWGIRYSDLGPFRAIRYRSLLQLDMADQDYGWTVEMQIKAALHGLPADEVPVSYRKRVGISKVSGTIRGVFGAGYKILSTIFLSALLARPALKTGILIFFSRFPEAGTTKTRLIPALGAEGAADLQRQMTEHTLSVAPPLRKTMDVGLRFTGDNQAQMADWLGPELLYAPQGDGDLGARMARAMEEAFAAAYGKVILVGSDCPALDSATTTAAVEALDNHDMVLGPAADGGYYLIGMTLSGAPEDINAFFADMSWGTDSVLEATRARAVEQELTVFELPVHPDVDLPEDLPGWEAARDRHRVSIVIPTWNEAERIRPVLKSLLPLENTEVIVADGGSTDATVAIARELGVQVVSSVRGRAHQMNAGADAASGNLLLFVHADTQLPRDAIDCVRRALAFPEVALGAFELRIDGPGARYRWLELTANARSRRLGVPYGDQVFFLRRDVFDTLGGYAEWPILEDYDLVRRAQDRGTLYISPSRVRTSARRWEREGIIRLTCRNIVTFFAFPLGVSPARIARWYGRGEGEV